MKQNLPSWRWDNKWPFVLWLIGTIFSVGFIYSQFQTVINNQEKQFAQMDKIEGRLGTDELNVHSLFTYHPGLIELRYKE